METIKICRICGRELPLTEFNLRHRERNIYYHHCRSCAAGYRHYQPRGVAQDGTTSRRGRPSGSRQTQLAQWGGVIIRENTTCGTCRYMGNWCSGGGVRINLALTCRRYSPLREGEVVSAAAGNEYPFANQ